MENIRGQAPVNDPDYRYKMPRLEVDIESRPSGIATVIVNAGSIVDAIQRPMDHFAKYLSVHLSVRVRHHPGRNVLILRGLHAPETLAHYLYGYIECYVLCPQCRLPEASLIFRIRHGLWLRCCACEAQTAVQDTVLLKHIERQCVGPAKN
jgi:translation initiation factor 5